VWVPAEAKIEGSDVVLTAAGVEKPLAMRFAAYNGSTPNLVNGAGLPAGPFHCGVSMKIGDAESLPELKGMTCVQRYDIPKSPDFTRRPPKTLASREGVTRVAYLLELQDAAGEVSFVMAAMDAFAAKSDDLVLSGKPASRLYRKPLANLTVRSNSPSVKALTDASTGFIEFYTCNFSPRTMSTPAGGDAAKYDFNDSPQRQATLGYGCLQVHDLAARATVLAYNRFNNPNTPCDVGIGNNPDGRGNPDWTFSSSAKDYAARRISVWVK
jgi:sialate O-acetylesterase